MGGVEFLGEFLFIFTGVVRLFVLMRSRERAKPGINTRKSAIIIFDIRSRN